MSEYTNKLKALNINEQKLVKCLVAGMTELNGPDSQLINQNGTKIEKLSRKLDEFNSKISECQKTITNQSQIIAEHSQTISEQNELISSLKSEIICLKSELKEGNLGGAQMQNPGPSIENNTDENEDAEWEVAKKTVKPTYSAAVSANFTVENRYRNLQNSYQTEHDRKEKEEKQKNFILTNLPEGQDPKSMEKSDMELIKNVAKDLSLQVKIKKVHRLGKPKQEGGTKNCRKLLVVTESSMKATEFQKRFIKMKKEHHWEGEDSQIPRHCLIMPDLVRTEQKYLQQLHEKCHKKNLEAGVRGYIVRNMEIVRNPLNSHPKYPSHSAEDPNKTQESLFSNKQE